MGRTGCLFSADFNTHNAVHKEAEPYPECGVGHSPSLGVVKGDLLLTLRYSE